MPPPRRARHAASPRKRPTQERSRETVRAILEAAARIFEQDGVDAATTDRIAARAGISVGSLYQYYPNKDAILVALAHCHLLETAAALEPGLAALDRNLPLEQALLPLVRTTVGLHAARSRLHRLLFSEALPDPSLWQAIGAARDAACARVARYLAGRPEVRVADPALAARVAFEVLMALAHGFALDPRAGGSPETRAQEVATVLRRYLTGSG
jgi:AcrR family transcriptional regulator